MKEHARHIQQHLEVGKILVYGPVMASGGAFGLAIFEVANEGEVRQFGENDPTVRAGLNKFELYPDAGGGCTRSVGLKAQPILQSD